MRRCDNQAVVPLKTELLGNSDRQILIIAAELLDLAGSANASARWPHRG
jgi:hypothetical protein